VPGAAEREHLRVSLGALLRRERGVAGLSQRRLAELAGCHPRTVERLERGQLRPTSALLVALAHALAIPAGWSLNAAKVEKVRVRLVEAAGVSLVESTPGGARRRRRRMRKARQSVRRTAALRLRTTAAGTTNQTAELLAHSRNLIREARRWL
jgi:transcriptional regulator with XRE-family HTH domain